jgi:hypothetical protein
MFFHMDKTAKQAAMRARFPFPAGIIDDLRAVFGPAVVPTYMQQGDDSWGRELDESRYTVIAGDNLVLPVKKEEKHGR